MIGEGLARISEAIAKIDVRLGDLDITFKEKISSINAAFQEIRTGIDQIEVEFTKGTDQISDLTKKLKAEQKITEELNERIREIEASLSAIQLQNEAIIKNGSQREEELMRKDNVNAELKKQLEESQTQLAEFLKEMENNTSAIDDVKELKGEVAKLEQKIKMKDFTIGFFGGDVHSKLLALLVNSKNHQLSKIDIINKTQEDAANVLRAISDLTAKDIIDYDEESGILTIKDETLKSDLGLS